MANSVFIVLAELALLQCIQTLYPGVDILGQQFPSIRQWAFDALACPATSCECERAFSGAKRLLSPNLNALGDDIIEAWWDNRLVQLH